MLTIVNGVTSKQVLANEIINLLETMGLDGYFYLGYPVLGGIDGKIKVDALLVSEQTGIVLFDLETLAEENMEDKIQLLDELYNNMEAKLKRYGYLSKRRVLQVPINVLSYAPLYKTKSDEICTSIEEVKEYLESLEWKQGEEYYKKLLEAIQMISQLKKRGGRKNLQKASSRGSKLKAIEVAQAAYDSRMWRFVWRLRSRNLCQCVSCYGGQRREYTAENRTDRIGCSGDDI